MMDMAAALPEAMCSDDSYVPHNSLQDSQLSHHHQQDLPSSAPHREHAMSRHQQDLSSAASRQEHSMSSQEHAMSRHPDLYPTPPQDLHINLEPEPAPFPQVPLAPEVPQVPKLKVDFEPCFGCGYPIKEKYLYLVGGCRWHAECLKCSICLKELDTLGTCFIKEGNVYCKPDYLTLNSANCVKLNSIKRINTDTRTFATKCSKCARCIQSSDWVRKAKDCVYHLACFACDSCKRQLSTGEEFALHDGRVLCKTHYTEAVDGGSSSDTENSQKNKTKRVRTTFSEEQLQVLQANFQMDSNPDGQDLERIAQITGLSKRVTQVWFQNSRARQKKHQQQHTKHGCNGTMLNHNGSNNGTISPLSTNSSNVGRCMGNLAVLGMDEDDQMI